MKVLVFGAGAIGSVVGGMLARAGHSVTLVGRAAHMDAVRSKGLRITGIWGEHLVTGIDCITSLDKVPPSAAPGAFDLVLVTVKSYDTESSAEKLRPLVGGRTLVVSMQNGYGNIETLEDALGDSHVLGSRVIFGAELRGPGHVEVTVYAEEVLVGSRLGRVDAERVGEIARALSAAGIPARATDKISQHVWGKILYNAALNPLGTILRLRYGELGANTHLRDVMDSVVHEIFAVTRASHIDMLWERPEDYLGLFYAKLVPSTAGHYPSMIRDVELGRRTEIDYLNGAVVRLGARANVATPVNAVLTDQVKFLEDPTGSHHWEFPQSQSGKEEK